MFSEEWNEVMSEVLKFQNKYSNTWFRGQKDSNFKLVSGLYREKKKEISTYIATERTYYGLFSRNGLLSA
ncbi:hypothetical protein RCO48_04510 [Peribacillus frigoritolerans]|nr:hypothetical protein [Peribacillus frigoritolerans]